MRCAVYLSALYKFLNFSLICTISPIDFTFNRGQNCNWQHFKNPKTCRCYCEDLDLTFCQNILNLSRDSVPLKGQQIRILCLVLLLPRRKDHDDIAMNSFSFFVNVDWVPPPHCQGKSKYFLIAYSVSWMDFAQRGFRSDSHNPDPAQALEPRTITT